MLSGIRQLLFNPFHDLPEGGSVEGVRVPAGPHNLIPAQRHTNTQTHTLLFIYTYHTPFLDLWVCTAFLKRHLKV